MSCLKVNILIFIFLLSSCSSFRLAGPDLAKSEYKSIGESIEGMNGKELFSLLENIEGRIVTAHGSYPGIKFENKRLQLREISHITGTSLQKVARMGLGIQNCILKNKSIKTMTICLNEMIEDGKIRAYTDYRLNDKENANQTTRDYMIWICGKKKFTTNMDGRVEHNSLPVEADFLLNTGISDHWFTLKKIRRSKLCKRV